MVHDLTTINFVACIDPPNSAFDKYINMLQIDHLDISSKYSRTNSRALNIRFLCDFVKENKISNLLILMSLPTEKFQQETYAPFIPPNSKLYCVLEKFISIEEHNMVLQGVPRGLSIFDFENKVGSHLTRIVNNQPVGSPLNAASMDFPKSQYKIKKIREIVSLPESRGTAVLIEQGVQFDFLYNIKKERSLVIIGQSAISRKDVNLPVFHRWKWADELEATTIVLNDPTLYNDKNLNGG